MKYQDWQVGNKVKVIDGKFKGITGTIRRILIRNPDEAWISMVFMADRGRAGVR